MNRIVYVVLRIFGVKCSHLEEISFHAPIPLRHHFQRCQVNQDALVKVKKGIKGPPKDKMIKLPPRSK